MTEAALTQIAFQGFLTDQDGLPVVGTVPLIVTLHNAPVGGTALWSSIYPAVEVQNGIFHIILGGGASPLSDSLFTGAPLYLGVSVNGEAELTPRTPLLASPFAIRAAVADSAVVSASAAGSGNTLDQAYDQGGPGAGRLITADSGPVQIDVPGGGEGLRVAGSARVEGHLRLSTGGAGDTLLFLDTDREWMLLQGNSGPSSELQLVSIAQNKYFRFVTDGKIVLQPYNAGSNCNLEVQGTTSTKVLQITGADLVESFDVEHGVHEPGTVLVIDDTTPGRLRVSRAPYDRKVAGVVSGAGGIAAGIHMGCGGPLDGDTPVAMTGRIYVKCTAENGAIRPGDRLTTSSVAGHAMRASDTGNCDGAVIGKAMSSLESGEGLVLVLVNLQ